MMIYRWEWVAGGINYLMTFWFYPALIIIFNSRLLTKLFSHRFIGTLGKITYDTYLWHNPNYLLLYIVPTVTGWNWNLLTVKSMLIYTVVSFAVGTFSYYAIEKPIEKWVRKRLISM